MNDLYGLLIFTARIRYTCPDNYRLVVNGAFHSEPSYTTICGVNGLWNGSVPECRSEFLIPVYECHTMDNIQY